MVRPHAVPGGQGHLDRPRTFGTMGVRQAEDHHHGLAMVVMQHPTVLVGQLLYLFEEGGGVVMPGLWIEAEG